MAGFVYFREKSYAKTLENCLYAMTSLGISLDESSDLCHKIDKVFDGWPMEEVFKPLAYGAFKEVYLLNDNFVIKFCSGANCTEDEINILQNAFECGLDQFFLPTHFIPLPYIGELPLNALSEDSWNSYYCKDDAGYADYIIIQPRAIVAEDLPFVLYDKKDYDGYPLIHPNTQEPIPRKELFSTHIHSLTWMQDVLDIYGYKHFTALIAFIKKLGLFDLHLGNIGYYQEQPILLDWLSH